ncbi:MAG: BlaI/MecI/CopY family transcriptional regulator [Verrucomicrobiales bacterium]|nr:BlaI/MecI/CopY family transcriptional regulator [Verrucomicrobiales bacterium]MCP5527478.1 BlaI/MecI/CopY family transcriptional regulator [Verrucomicrobiales bacterium]
MKPEVLASLSRRERQIMEVIYQAGEAPVSEVQAALPDPPSYSAVRALIRILEQKGHLRHRQDGLRYIYRPAHAREKAGRLALRRVVQSFYQGSLEHAVTALLDPSEGPLTAEQAGRLMQLIEQRSGEVR